MNDLPHGGGDMNWLGRGDSVLLAVAVYVAVMTLVRMMLRRRDQLVAEVQQQVDSHRKRPKILQDRQNRDAA